MSKSPFEFACAALRCHPTCHSICSGGSLKVSDYALRRQCMKYCCIDCSCWPHPLPPLELASEGCLSLLEQRPQEPQAGGRTERNGMNHGVATQLGKDAAGPCEDKALLQ